MRKNVQNTSGAIEISLAETFFQQQRRTLGISSDLDNKPVLYLSAHRGFFSAKYTEHLKAFMQILNNSDNDNKTEKQYSILDLSKTNPDELRDRLWDYISKIEEIDPNNQLSDGTAKNVEPLPAFLLNVILLPPLDTSGNSTSGPSRVFSIEKNNCGVMLEKLANALKEQGYLRHTESKKAVPREITPQ